MFKDKENNMWWNLRVVSTTMTMKSQARVFPAPSLAVAVTVVGVPVGKVYVNCPLLWEGVIVWPLMEYVTVGVDGNPEGVALFQEYVADWVVMDGGHNMLGTGRKEREKKQNRKFIKTVILYNKCLPSLNTNSW